MKKVKGLVLESTEERVFLLTPEGEYLELPGRGEVFDTGAEIELEPPQGQERKRNLFLPAFAAAAVILVFACCLALYSALYRPEAYLALDINPSLYFSLNEEGRVIKAEPLNEDAEEILKGLRLQGKNIREVLTLILDGAYAGDYLSDKKENVILISLAAPESFIVSEDDLRALVSERILSMEVNTYLKVTTMEPQRAVEARDKGMPVNSLVLGEQMLKKGLIEEDEEPPPEEESSAGEKSPPKKEEPGPPPAVRELLGKVRPEKIFEPEEYIRGKKLEERSEHAGPKEEMFQHGGQQEGSARRAGQEREATERTGQQGETPQRAGPQGRTPGSAGSPEEVPSKQVGREPEPFDKGKPAPGADKEAFIPPGQDKEAFIPPGRDEKEAFTSSGRDKDTVIPPGRNKEVVIPPERDKGEFVPPGLEKNNHLPPGWIKNKIRSISGLHNDKRR